MHAAPVDFLRWIPLLPLLSAAILGLANRRLPNAVVSLLGAGSVLGSFVISIAAFLRLRGMEATDRVLHDSIFSWIAIGDLRIDAALQVDALSAVMILVVTGVGFLIHVYSIGYMKGDPGFQRFFAYLNLFVFAMLTLVTADNLVLLFVGWEGVGLCSYLLIGFWFQDMANSVAAKKAFIVNRVGDFGFLLGMFVIFKALVGHADGANLLAFSTMQEHAALLAPVATLAGLLLFVGATGKSAQIPLYVWLPDAMAGPTPVSALIHAATMVTAGVYMVARMAFLYDMSSVALGVIAVIGALTALLGATIALAQTDIKKVLAYSTVSQLGYMFLACGVGAYAVGIFHVMTHAFFKALLFLGAGSVIHALHHEQDMRNMGGLRKALPRTFLTMAVGTVAIAGVFPFAGFFSKDEILYKAFLDSPALWAVGFAVAGLTAFYMARLLTMTFFGESRVSADKQKHLHESPAVMTLPLVVLAVLSLVGGWIGWPEFMGGSNPFHHWLEPVFHGGHDVAGAAHGAVAAAGTHASEAAHAAETASHGEGSHNVALEWGLALLSVVWAVVALWFGYRVYARKSDLPQRAAAFGGGLPHRLLAGKYFVDEAYEAVILRPTNWFSDKVLWRIVDAGLIDGVVNGVGSVLSLTSSLVRMVQNGLLRWYAYSFLAGVLVILVYLTRSQG